MRKIYKKMERKKSKKYDAFTAFHYSHLPLINLVFKNECLPNKIGVDIFHNVLFHLLSEFLRRHAFPNYFY